MIVERHEPTGNTSRKISCTKGNSTSVASMMIDYRSNDTLLAAVWMDKRYIYFVSTLHRAETSGDPTTVKRRQLDGT